VSHLFIKALNIPALIFILCIGIGIQSALFSYQPLHYFKPEIGIFIVLWCALKRKFTEGGIVTLIAAYIVELHSSAPSGTIMSAYMLSYLLLRSCSGYLLLSKPHSMLILTAVFSLTIKVFHIIILSLINPNDLHWFNLFEVSLPNLITEVILATWIFRLLKKLDWVTFKYSKEEQPHDDLKLTENEGL